VSQSADINHQLPSHYYTDIPYKNSDYEPATSHLVETPLNTTTHFTSPTVDNLSVHNRQQHFISTTNLSAHDPSYRHQQQNDHKHPLTYSTPYLSQVRDIDSPPFKTTFQPQQQQQQIDRHSAVGSDSGIVMTNSNHQQQTHENTPVMEKKLTNLVQQLGRQLETDTQKLNEKFEIKLKSLEHMINQQTFVIRRQDEVIERLKSKILHIETERDHFRQRLSIHEQRENDDKFYLTSTGPGQLNGIKSNFRFYFIDLFF
jgi:hypothetical protein